MNWSARLLRRKEQETDLDKELSFHVEQRVLDLIRSGLAEEEARRSVRQEFGCINRAGRGQETVERAAGVGVFGRR